MIKFTKEEVNLALFDIPGNKAPGPDGFSSFFFQDNWELVGKDIFEAVTSFLETEVCTTYCKGLKMFSKTFGLQPNAAKSAIYTSNMPEEHLRRILAVSGFQHQSLPFTDLGVPIGAKKISGKTVRFWQRK
uniref:Reverse transcriptase n=1 Tax=Cannabis sativa TaxID=3483 RepID=A0A803QGP8_CANSA